GAVRPEAALERRRTIMGALRSKLFSIPEDRKLEACLVDDSKHIGPGENDSSEQVEKIQLALETIIGVDLKSERGRYGPLTVAAVKKYKNEHRPPILQPWQKTADQYVGKRTIRHLDDDMSAFDRRGRGGGLEIPKDKKFVDQPPGEIYLITVR